MFIGYYELNNKQHFNIYYKTKNGYDLWYNNTFSPDCKNINILNFLIYGKEYKEKQNYLIELAKKWQYEFAYLEWSYGELAIIETYFYKNAKRYGLLKEFKENGIC